MPNIHHHLPKQNDRLGQNKHQFDAVGPLNPRKKYHRVLGAIRPENEMIKLYDSIKKKILMIISYPPFKGKFKALGKLTSTLIQLYFKFSTPSKIHFAKL